MDHRHKILALALASLAPSAFASGFALTSQNGSGNGNAFAGAAAVAEDAGTIFFNPAGMTLLGEGHNISVAATLLNRKIEFSNTGTTTLLPPLGSNGGDAGGFSVIPAAYWAMSLSPALRIGVGISPTFGNKTEYSSDFMGRFSGYFADLQQINVNPSVAYKINNAVSVGFGINYAKSEIEFRFKAPIIPPGAQGTAILKGDDDAWGWNVGAMFQVSPTTRLGAAYRSKMKFDLEGNQAVTLDATGAAVAPASYAIRSTLETPDNFSLALDQKLGDRWELLADVTWTGWSSVKALPVIQASSGVQTNSLSYNFKNTWRAGLGANYMLNDAWKLRVGIAYDEAPVQNDADRTMTLPDSDRTWLSVGARYSLSKSTSLDIGYSHIFFKDASTAKAVTNYPPTTTLQTVRGNFETSADYLSFQLNHRF
jgi:long-chain fatty acid transport protein